MSNQGTIALAWWEELNDDPAASDPWKKKGNPGALARLRRASNPVEALAEARTMTLAKRLGVRPGEYQTLARVWAMAAVLAHVKEHDGSKNMSEMLGPPKEGEQGVMSELRFHRLIAASEPADLMRQMRNAVKLLKGTANIEDLANAIYWWGDKTRINWTYAYWGAAFASPAITDTTDQSAQETI